MEPERLFVLLLKQADAAQAILRRLADFLQELTSLYASAGVDFLVVEEGGAASISPALFGQRVLPSLRSLFAEKPSPMVLSITGGTDALVGFMKACDPDGICIDRQCDIRAARDAVDAAVPLFTRCENHELLASDDPEAVAAEVRRCLETGVATVVPPADIYPPARKENIAAFVRALQTDE
jgi:uroporphyrinogen-III decarboxylase